MDLIIAANPPVNTELTEQVPNCLVDLHALLVHVHPELVAGRESSIVRNAHLPACNFSLDGAKPVGDESGDKCGKRRSCSNKQINGAVVHG